MSQFQHSLGYIASYKLLDDTSLDVCQLLGQNGFKTTKRDILNLLKDFGEKEGLLGFKSRAITILLFYIKIALQDNLLSPEEMYNVRYLKRLFDLEEGDLSSDSKNATEIAAIIKVQMELIYADKSVNKDEALHKVNLQEIFGLNYDEFLKLSNDSVLPALDKGADWIEIDTFISTEEFYRWNDTRETEFESSGFEEQTRHISQDVKDDVWNRDGGKCVQCGSNENLEFDHIIPHSKGGANTYRNIQLLCQSCNRQKSDNIG